MADRMRAAKSGDRHAFQTAEKRVSPRFSLLFAVGGVFLSMLLAVYPANAQDTAAPPAAALRGGLGVLDWMVVGLYALVMIGIGVFYSYRTRTSEEYYLGGRRMRPGMVGLSLFATMISTITYLAIPGEMMKHGPVYLTTIAAIPIIFLIVGYLLIPYIMTLPITSAYEILDRRFGRPTRLLGCTIFLLIRFIWMGLVILTSAKVVVRAVGLPPEQAPYVAIVLGAVTVVYSSIGGLRAVVLTDVIQSAIMFFGAILTIIIITVKMGGVGWFPTQWASNWDVQPVFSFDPRVRVTMLGTVLAATTWWVCTCGSDQMAIQRYLATRDARAARRAFLTNNMADASVTLLLSPLGFALLGFFREHPQYLTEQVNLQQNTDLLFPYFIVNFLHFGLAGLVISGMLAAAMSSLSSGINSTCTVINTDIIGYFLRENLSEKTKVRIAKSSALLIGVVVILLSWIIDSVRGNLLEVTSKTSNLLVAPLFGLFFFAMFVPFATPMGAAFGSLYGFLAAFLFAFGDLAGLPPLSWQWILPSALVSDVVTGTLVSLIPVRNGHPVLKALLIGILLIPFTTVMVIFFLHV